MAQKQTSPELSTLAGQMMVETRRLLRTPHAITVEPEYLRDVMRLCGSVIGQDEESQPHDG